MKIADMESGLEMEYPGGKNQHFRHLLFFAFHRGQTELAAKMNCDHKTTLNHLHSMGFVEKLGAWVPHELTENNKENRLQIASQHVSISKPEN
ncbi:histone-lysine N-methyltransferase SETMAR-like [Lasioglossum baleicum]|uniref:histone-lysine N-methyltransferase SETMAR-like n=1 Tax=Lasioglossum baleicum TaxID=434251 RepID=UPI003FCE8919